MPHLPDDQLPTTGPADDRFELLWNDYLEGELDATGMTELAVLLAEDARRVTRAADLYQTHRRLGLIATARREPAAGSTDADVFVADIMSRLGEDGTAFTGSVMARIGDARGPRDAAGAPRRPAVFTWLAAGAMLATAVSLAAVIAARRDSTARPEAPPAVVAEGRRPDGRGYADEGPRFASLARPRFLGRNAPAVGSTVPLDESHVLSSGLVEIVFPIGATAIVEGPAVFRVRGRDCLTLDAGRCSVHAPEGAEGFRVETPATDVIDRGTRFVVRVDESTASEVQVIEGAADLVERSDPSGVGRRLQRGEKARHDPAGQGDRIVVTSAALDASGYRKTLPDRLIGYTATLRHGAPADAETPAAAGVDTLESLDVQRGGMRHTIDVASLIGVRILHFRATHNRNNLTLPGSAAPGGSALASPRGRRDLLEADRLLTTGVINPGGAPLPLADDPVLEAGDDRQPATPGLAVRFERPVINDPGPDVLLFDLQMLNDPPEGDAFHVSPLRFSTGLHSHTVTAYDIDSTSPESKLLAPFRLFKLDVAAGSLTELLSASTNGGVLLPVRARANAVGIDLSSLGYAAGAVCEGLFFQDAADDDTTIDPVFIAGLPPLGGDAAAEEITR